MKYRQMGNTDLEVSEIGLGCNKLGESIFGNLSKKDSLRLLNEALDCGINTFDTAPTYSYGDSEQLIGESFKHQRGRVILTTKVGRLPSSLAKYGKSIRSFVRPVQAFLKPFKQKLKKASKNRFDFSNASIESSLSKSLKRLQTDYIDLLLLHNPSLEVLQKGDVFETLENLKKMGAIRYYGVSIDTIEEAKMALQYPINGLQISFNLMQQVMAHQLFEEKKTLQNVGIMVKAPFLRGLITPKQNLPKEYFGPQKIKQLQAKFDEMQFLFAQRPMNHAALQFVLQYPQVSTVLCGTTSTTHLKDNLAYQNAKPFTSIELARIQEVQEIYDF